MGMIVKRSSFALLVILVTGMVVALTVSRAEANRYQTKTPSLVAKFTTTENHRLFFRISLDVMCVEDGMVTRGRGSDNNFGGGAPVGRRGRFPMRTRLLAAAGTSSRG